MTLSNKDISLIEKYIKGELEPSEELDFQRRMTDDAFQQEVKFQQGLRRAEISIGREELKKSFKSWDAETSGRIQNTSFFNNRWTIAAGFLILIVAGMIFLRPRLEHTTQDLYLAHYQSFPNLVDPLEKGAEDPEPTASQYYEMGNHASALTQPTQDTAQLFYQGLSHLALTHSEDAISILDPISQYEGHRFRVPALWYLSLAYLYSGDIEKSRQQLRQILELGDKDFEIDARQLLAELEDLERD